MEEILTPRSNDSAESTLLLKPIEFGEVHIPNFDTLSKE